MTFHNNPGLTNEGGIGQVKRYEHQPLTIDHYGIRASIKANGRIVISSGGTPVAGSEDVEYDEVEVPASLIFKLATLLKATQKITYVNVSETPAAVKEK